ncbi:MAG: TIGR01620 family protein [Magnetococcus sp. DMHC-8]
MGIPSPWLSPLELDPPAPGRRGAPVRREPVILPVEADPIGEQPTGTDDDPLEPGASLAAAVPARPTSAGRFSLHGGLLVVLGLLFVSLLIRDTLLFLAQQWEIHPLLGLFFSMLVLALGGMLSMLVGREWRRFRRLRTLTALRQEAGHLMDCQTFGSALRLVNRLTLLYRERAELVPPLRRFQQQVNDYLGDREILTLFSSHVLTTVDNQAYQVVVRHASAAAVMTAISPMAWLDALFFTWRSLWMVREIAEVYGARPGAAGSLLLLRQAIRGIMGAGLTDLLASSTAHSMGDSVAALLMARTGQGIANGLFIARIGLQTMQVCRPLPFGSTELPSLTRVRQALQQEIKNSATPLEPKD